MEDGASTNRRAPRSDDDHSNAPSVLVALLNRIPRARRLTLGSIISPLRGYWLLAIGYWLSAIGYRLLAKRPGSSPAGPSAHGVERSQACRCRGANTFPIRLRNSLGNRWQAAI